MRYSGLNTPLTRRASNQPRERFAATYRCTHGMPWFSRAEILASPEIARENASRTCGVTGGAEDVPVIASTARLLPGRITGAGHRYSNGPIPDAMLAMARMPITSTSTAVISVSDVERWSPRARARRPSFALVPGANRS